MREKPTDTTLEATRKKIAERVRPVCIHMAEEEFEVMVTRMALIEWKHASEVTPTSRMVG